MSVEEDLTGQLDAVVPAVLRRTGTPGAIVLLARGGRTLLRRAWGSARTHDERGPLDAPVPMRPDTITDVASLTKVAATTAVAMVLVQQGRLDPEAPAQQLLPEWRVQGAERVRVRHLLAHRSGLPDWAPLFLYAADGDADGALAALCATPLISEPGTATVYSDLGMALLGEALGRAGGAPLDALARDLVYRHLGMDATGYGPRQPDVDGCAATSTGNPVERRMVLKRCPPLVQARLDTVGWWRPRTLLGEVNDANAAIAFRGVAGHAGLFSTADDIARFGEELLRTARGEDGAVLSADVVRRFLVPGPDPAYGWGFWLRRRSTVLGIGDPAADGTFGHRGFTGCELLVDPADGTVLVLLSNRLHGGDPPPAHAPLWSTVLRAAAGGAPPMAVEAGRRGAP